MTHTVLLVFALVCFVLAALQQPQPPPRINLIAAGLAFYVASLISF